MYGPGDLLADTRVVADAQVPDVYHCTISPSWNILYAFGGVTMASAVSAARAALRNPQFELLTATATFLSPVSAGPVNLHVRRLREGKGSEQLIVELRQGASDKPHLHVVTTFAPPRPSEGDFVELTCPEVLPPDQVHQPEPPADYTRLKLPYHDSVEVKTVLGRMPWDRSWDTGPARWQGWYRYKVPPRAPDGTLDPLAYVPACDMIGPALFQKRGPNSPSMMVVSLEIALHFFARTTSEWLLQDTEVYQAARGYASGRVHLWDTQKTLLAHGLQRAVMRPRPF